MAIPIKVIMAILRFIFEIVLLIVIVETDIRKISDLGIGLIVNRLIMGLVGRILQAVRLDQLSRKVLGYLICVFKIGLETGIFFAVKIHIDIPMDIVPLILFLMLLRNISDVVSFLAIEPDEFDEL